MKGDFSKQNFKPYKHYSSVRMQQGRVQLDADWNEQMDIFDHRLQMNAADLIGLSGAPKNNSGFKISITDDLKNLQIAVGRYYINGWLCENGFSNSAVTSMLYTQQADYPIPAENMQAYLPKQAGHYLVYLDAWQRHVTAVEDSDIREIALGGADTATRLQTVAQVKLLPIATLQPVHDLPEWQALNNVQSGKMAIQLNTPNFANQLYRVEIHRGGSYQEAGFKWSRDNAAIALVVENLNDGNLVEVKRTKADEHIRFMSGNWVELNSTARELRGSAGLLVQLREVNGAIFKLEDLTDAQLIIYNELRHDTTIKTLRIWNSAEIALNLPEIALDNGLMLAFEKDKPYRAGDYWLIATRAIENKVDWPSGVEGFQYCLPQGINHVYAPLALVEWQENGFVPGTLQDYRSEFMPISQLSTQVLGKAPTAPDSVIYVNEKGQVGINTHNPQAALDINGHIHFSNSEATSSFSTAAFGAISPLFIRGTGAKDNKPALLKLGSKILEITARGLTLIKLSPAHVILSVTSFDTASGDAQSLQALKDAIEIMETRQIGILVSYDTWEWSSSIAAPEFKEFLITVGLGLAAETEASSKPPQPYAAIFEKSPLATANSCKIHEVLQDNSTLSLSAEIVGWLMDGAFVINSNK